MDQLSSRQLSEWEAYDKIDPIGEWVEEFRFARLQTLILTIALKWAAGKKPVEAVDAMDFMPDWLGEREPKKQTVEQMKKFLLSFAKNQNKKVAKGKAKPKEIQSHGKYSRINNGRTRNEDEGNNSSRASDGERDAKHQPGSRKDL